MYREQKGIVTIDLTRDQYNNINVIEVSPVEEPDAEQAAKVGEAKP